LEIRPDALPLDEVKKYLVLTSFQPQFLEEARQLDSFSLERNIRDVESPIGYLLPEIQSMRELARLQSLRCRVAVAENRADDAVEILGQQFALAAHLSEDEFVISNLVGAAVASIAWTDLTYVLEMPDAPNLYWALSTLPKPLIDMKKSLALERQLVFQQLRSLRDVDETLKPAGYWQVFVDDIFPQLTQFSGLADTSNFSTDDSPLNRAGMVAMIAAAYPGARHYLIEELKLPIEQVDQYPTAQVVFLAMRRFSERSSDEVFKWNYLPFAIVFANDYFVKSKDERERQVAQFGWFTFAADSLLGWQGSAGSAQQRVEMQIAMTTTVESIRSFAAENGGQMPESIEGLPLPAPVNPVTAKPYEYTKKRNTATLTATGDRIIYQFVIEN
jgi:hypothetical protein